MAFTHELEQKDGQGHPREGEGYLHHCRSAPLPRGRVLLRSREGPLPP